MKVSPPIGDAVHGDVAGASSLVLHVGDGRIFDREVVQVGQVLTHAHVDSGPLQQSISNGTILPFRDFFKNFQVSATFFSAIQISANQWNVRIQNDFRKMFPAFTLQTCTQYETVPVFFLQKLI